MTWLDALTEKALARELPTRAEALEVLQSTDDELMDVVAAAFKVRLRYFGRRVKLNYLVNIKSGLCPEDCFYCSQRLGSAADVLKYTWLKPDEVLESAEAGVRAGRQAGLPGGQRPRPERRGHRPGSRRDRASSRSATPTSRSAPASACSPTARPSGCTQAGTTAYNHNLNTAETNYGDICTTHPTRTAPTR